MSPHPPDFERLFAEGRVHDLGHRRPGLVATIRNTAGPRLRLPTGRLVACEPGDHFPDGAVRNAFVQRVEPGSYPVWLVIADYVNHSEVAAARFAIGLREELAVGRVEVRISDQRSGVANHPRATVTVADGYALTGGGAQAHWRGAGSLLWQSAPLPDSAGYTVGAKDHGRPAPCEVSAYAVGIRIVPRA